MTSHPAYLTITRVLSCNFPVKRLGWIVEEDKIMKNIGVNNLINRRKLVPVFMWLIIVIISSSLGLAQGSGDQTIDLAQQAIRGRMLSREGGRDLNIRFNNDARTEFRSNAEVIVRGTGIFSRNNNMELRNFSYVTLVNRRNNNVSDINYNWIGGWYSSGAVNNYGGQIVYCASDDMKRHSYSINTSGGVRLVQQKSDAPCVEGQTWGHNRNSIWVDRGCRADFEVGRSGGVSISVTNRLTGTYRLNQSRSDNPGTVADRVTRNLARGDQQRLRNAVMRRLESPELLAIERNGRTITLASSLAAQITFDADGREQIEQTRNGRSIRTSATLSGDRLKVNSVGDRSVDFQVTFEPIDNGRGLRVTRRITDEGLKQAVVAKSVYDKSSDVAQLDVYSGARDYYPQVDVTRDSFFVPDGTQLVAVLNDNLSTKQAREGDRFTLTIRSPSPYDGSSIQGHVMTINKSGRVAGRAEMSLEFDSIRLRDGRTSNFAGYIESIRTVNGENIRVDNEGRVQDPGGQTNRTLMRTGIGAAIGAVIGAIAGGGKGAAIGAAIGAGAGAGSVLIQGRDDLELMSGTEFMIRASAPRLGLLRFNTRPGDPAIVSQPAEIK